MVNLKLFTLKSECGLVLVGFESGISWSRGLNYSRQAKGQSSYSKLVTHFKLIKWDAIIIHSIPNEKDILLLAEERYALVNYTVVCMCDTWDYRLCAVAFRRLWVQRMIFLVMPPVDYKMACPCHLIRRYDKGV